MNLLLLAAAENITAERLGGVAHSPIRLLKYIQGKSNFNGPLLNRPGYKNLSMI